MKFFFLIISAVFSFSLLNAMTEKVDKTEEEIWIRNLIPLPHKISIKEKNIINVANLEIKTYNIKHPLEKNALQRLEKVIKAGEKRGNDKKFTISAEIIDISEDINASQKDDFKKLSMLPNPQQAYLIHPDGNNAVVLRALNGKGLYYAIMTLCQLMEPYISGYKVTIPLADIVDWPDFEERGVWNQPKDRNFVEWLAEMKLNHGRMWWIGPSIKKEQPCSMKLDMEYYNCAKLKAFNLMPDITHLNFLHRYGLFNAYPELEGKGKKADAGSYFAHGKNANPVPCASNPLLSEILAQLMMNVAEQGCMEIGCWLTERPAQCQCGECLAVGQFVKEAEAFINAWNIVRVKYPDFIIRLFISTTTDEKYYQILANLPEGVRIERACAAEQGRVNKSPRDIFRNPLFDYYASKGVWMASYDVPLTANGAVETPEFKLPEASAERIKDFVVQLYERKYQAVYGMLAWNNMNKEICGFNIAALAEWSWNVNGRTCREFALAWASKSGLKKIEDFADWADIMGSLEFDVYASDIPECYSRKKAYNLIKDKLYPETGKGIFRYYSNADAFDEKIRKARKALLLAEKFETPYYAFETKVIISYFELAKCIYRIALANYEGKENIVKSILPELKNAGEENKKAIYEWRTYLGREAWHHRVNDAIKATDETVKCIENYFRSAR